MVANEAFDDVSHADEHRPRSGAGRTTIEYRQRYSFQ
jgi:hypothetical protein